MFGVKRIFLSLMIASLMGTSVLAETDDKVAEMMKYQVLLLNYMAGLDSLALQTYLKINNPAIYDRVIAQVIKTTRGAQSVADFANEIGVSQDQLIASEETGKGLTEELLEKIWQAGTPPTTHQEIRELISQEMTSQVSSSELIVYAATVKQIRMTNSLLGILEELGTTKDGVKPTVGQLLASVKENYGRLLAYAKEEMPKLSIDNLIDKSQISDQLISELTKIIDYDTTMVAHIGRTFLLNKIKELEASEKISSES